MGKVGIIAFAFGQQGGGVPLPGPSNEAIVRVAEYISSSQQAKGNIVRLAVQWETNIFKKITPDVIISEFGGATHYVDTKYGLDVALADFRQNDVTELIIVAHPAHLRVIKLFIKSGQWKLGGGIHLVSTYDKLMQSIAYDRSPGNIQPWTRGPFRFFVYLVRAALFKKHGN